MRLDQLKRTPCTERSGFLFSHACSGIAYNLCDACRKAVCEEHLQSVDVEELKAQGLFEPAALPPNADRAEVCTSCAKKLARNERSSTHRYRRDDDPFWYADTYYPGYHTYGPGHWGAAYMLSGHRGHTHDPNDFTDADAGALRADGDGNFEMDASGS